MGDEQLYSHETMRRYLENKMTGEEMHAFEKAMMDDPFLSDALDGFKISDQEKAQQHLADIGVRVRAGREQTRIVEFTVKRTKWWKAAAIVIGLAATGTIIYSVLNQQPNETRVALEAAQPKQDTVRSVEKTFRNSLADKNEVAPGSALPVPDKVFPNTAAVNPAKKKLVFDSLPHDADQALASLSLENKPAAPAPMTMMRQKEPPPLNEFKGKVIDSSGQPIPYANVQAEGRVTTMTDRAGNFSVVTPDTAVRVNISSAGYDVAKSELSKPVNPAITMNRSNTPLEEVVVAYGTRKKAAVTGGDTSLSKNVKNAEPEGGWQSFQEYVYKKLNRSPDTTFHGLNGDLEVEFTIDEKGKPENIRLVSPADRETTDKAIQLLQNGPRWKRNSRNAKARIRLKVN